MTTNSKLNFIFEMLDVENLSQGNKNETISCLKKTQKLLKSTSPSNDEQYFSDRSCEKEEDNYLFSHYNDFSDEVQKRLDVYSDDEYSCLKKEIDSYIKANDEEENNHLNCENKSSQDFLFSKKCNFLTFCNNFYFSA